MTSTPKNPDKRRKMNMEEIGMNFSGLSPIIAGAPDHRGDARRDETAIPDSQVNSEGEIVEEEEEPDVMVELQMNRSYSGFHVLSAKTKDDKESPDSPDETMIPPHEIDPPVPESPLFPPPHGTKETPT